MRIHLIKSIHHSRSFLPIETISNQSLFREIAAASGEWVNEFIPNNGKWNLLHQDNCWIISPNNLDNFPISEIISSIQFPNIRDNFQANGSRARSCMCHPRQNFSRETSRDLGQSQVRIKSHIFNNTFNCLLQTPLINDHHRLKKYSVRG